jgi:hypothetical protein
MPLDRRTFLETFALRGGAAGLGALPSFAHARGTGVDPSALTRTRVRAGVSLGILILGGTGLEGGS